MKTMGNIRKLFLLLCLVSAGVQSAWAQTYTYLREATVDGVTYYLYLGHYLYNSGNVASIKDISATGEVVIPRIVNYMDVDANVFIMDVYVKAAGWWYDQQRPEDRTCTSTNMSSLTFENHVDIHGKFSIPNLYGPLVFPNSSTLNWITTIFSDATLDIPRATSISGSMDVKGTINAPAITKLKSPQSVSGTINANAATEVTIPQKATISGTINASSATTVDILENANVSGTINVNAATKVTIPQKATISGTINATSATTVKILENANVSGTINVSSATDVEISGGAIYGKLISSQLRSIKLGGADFGLTGKLQCSNLRNIYIPNKNSIPNFVGNYSEHFTAPTNSITVHVYDMTPNEIAAMKNSAVWNGFKEIVNHKSNISYTLVTNGGVEMKLYQLNGNASFVSATSLSQIADILSGSKTGTVKGEGNYAVVLPSSNLANKNVQLTRNGQPVTLEEGDEQGEPVLFYEELNLQEDVRYEVTVTDKTCNFTLTQTGYKGNITYTKTLNGTTSSGLIYTSEGSFICAQGSTVKLSIPYDQYTPKTLEVNGSQKTLTYENGRATASFGVPSASSTAATLTWEPPAALPENHELPQVMVMRMGQGDVVLKDVFYTKDPQEMDYWRLDDPGWALRRTVNCEDAITTVTISDLDGSGNPRDDADWGFIVEATPLAGQIVKAVLLGHVPHGSNMMEWEDAFTEENLMPHLSIDATTGKCTLHMGGDEMWYGPGNYTVLVEMGPAESEVKTHASLNFVRKGGRSRVRLYREDCETDGWFDIDEGTTIHELKLYAPAEAEECGQSMNITQQLFVSPVEGEVIHIYCDGRDVTTQAWNDENEDYQLTLERADHTYTVLIDDAPDANPTWTIKQEEGMNTIVMYTKGDTYTETSYTGTLNKVPIDDTEIDKVTLKVYAENQNDSKPLRILRNGEDVSYMFNYMINDGQDGFRLCYEVPVNVLTNCDWDISYNTDHQQTFIVNGGTTEQVVEMEYEHLEGGPYLHANNDGIPATGYIPPFDNAKNSYVYLTFYVKEDETAKILRNGVDVTDLFERGSNYYDLQINDADYDGNNTLSALGFDIREAATWQITIDDGSNQPGVNYMFIGNYNYVTAYADYNEGYEYEGSQFHAENVEGYCVGKVIENGSCINEEMGMDIQMQNANDTFRAFRNGVDMTSQFSKGDGNIWTFTSRDATMHEPAQWIIVADNDLSRYDTNRDGEITIADVTKLVNKVLNR